MRASVVFVVAMFVVVSAVNVVLAIRLDDQAQRIDRLEHVTETTAAPTTTTIVDHSGEISGVTCATFGDVINCTPITKP